jgi:hypothetical protein
MEHLEDPAAHEPRVNEENPDHFFRDVAFFSAAEISEK